MKLSWEFHVIILPVTQLNYRDDYQIGTDGYNLIELIINFPRLIMSLSFKAKFKTLR